MFRYDIGRLSFDLIDVVELVGGFLIPEVVGDREKDLDRGRSDWCVVRGSPY